MNTQSTSKSSMAQPVLAHHLSTRRWTAAISALVLIATANAQELLPSAPQLPLVAPVMRPAAPDTSPSATSYQNFPSGELNSAGEFKLKPHVSTSYMHSTGLPTLAGARIGSDVFTFSPGIGADLGAHWSTDYTASWVNYNSDKLDDSVSHFVQLVGANKSPDLDLQLTESYSKTNSFLVETAKQTKQSTWANGLSADHKFGNVLSYHGTAGMTDTDSENTGNTREWLTEHWARGEISTKVNGGLGFGLGYTEIPKAPNTRFESYKGNLGWKATDKVELSLNGGYQHWHLLSTVQKNKWYPVLDATLSWLPFEHTKIAITDSRSVSVALVGDAVTSNKTWGVSLGQQLFGKLLLNLSYDHASADYDARTGTAYANRNDEIKSFRSSLAVQVYRHWALSGTYQSSKNSSSNALFQYDASQYGLQLSASF